MIVSLSARVGSIGDNSLGGWYSYRASKTALNQVGIGARLPATVGKDKTTLAVMIHLHPPANRVCLTCRQDANIYATVGRTMHHVSAAHLL